MLRFIHLALAALYGRALISLILLALAWDLYRAGPSNSVVATSAITLAERIAIDAQHLPATLNRLSSAVEAWLSRTDQVAGQMAEQVAEQVTQTLTPPPAPLTRLDDETLWAMTMASRRSGVSFTYLATTAQLESNFDTKAKAATSSASGLFQMTRGTWLTLMDTHGGNYGWGGHAQALTCTAPGRCSTQTPGQINDILDLRFDGMTSSFLAAELAKANEAHLTSALDRPVVERELYLAHFFGAAGATKFLQARETSPRQRAADLFPQAAKANRSIFYTSLGRARSVQEVDTLFAGRWDRAYARVAGFTPPPVPVSRQNRNEADIQVPAAS